MKHILFLTLLCLLAACSQPEKKPDTEKPAFRALGQKATVESTRNDETIGFEVRRRLELIGSADTAGIVVEINDGVVTLSGVAPTLTAAWKAEAAARTVPGVKDVINTVVPRNAGR